MSTRALFAFAAWSFLAFQQIDAQDRVPKPPVAWNENYIEGKYVPAGGHVRVGVMQLSTAPLNPQVLTALLPAPTARILCVSITSIDGRYAAELQYDAAAMSAGVQPLSVPTRYAGELKSYRADRLAAFASLNKSCAQPPEQIVIVSWGRPDSSTDVTVFLNSGVNATINDSDLALGACGRIEGTSIAYNVRCDLPIGKARSAAHLEVRRSRRPGVALEPIALPLFVP